MNVCLYAKILNMNLHKMAMIVFRLTWSHFCVNELFIDAKNLFWHSWRVTGVNRGSTRVHATFRQVVKISLTHPKQCHIPCLIITTTDVQDGDVDVSVSSMYCLQHTSQCYRNVIKHYAHPSESPSKCCRMHPEK